MDLSDAGYRQLICLPASGHVQVNLDSLLRTSRVVLPGKLHGIVGKDTSGFFRKNKVVPAHGESIVAADRNVAKQLSGNDPSGVRG